MYRRLLQIIAFSLLSTSFANAQVIDSINYRTIGGEYNNLINTDWGAAHTNLLFQTGNGFADGISQPGGQNRPNPRIISNTLFAQNSSILDPFNLSDFCWVWGQFLDHDLGLTPDGFEPAIIPVPAGDAAFDPLGLGTAVIPMMRNVFDPTTGTDVNNPRKFPNEITAFIDGSGVYGSDQDRADWLRSFEGGKMRVSAGNLLPWNTVDGEKDSEIDPDAPHMDDAVGLSDKLFVAGDVRANENVLLLAFHTIFVREHNRLCDLLAADHPDWTDEELYQHARKYVGGMIQSITYNEWLPALGVFLPLYQGYDDNVHPQLLNVFTAAAFRLGHTLLSSDIVAMDNEGNELPDSPFGLRELFFDLSVLEQVGGIEPFIKGMATQSQQMLDSKIVNDVRNFLFGPPEAGIGGLDLASINVNRGRERGLADLNTIRQNFNLEPHDFIQQVNGDASVYIPLQSLYPNMNIDAWVGMLAEEPMPGAIFGETILAIMQYQFANLRNGDRFFYLNDPVLTDQEKDYIHNATFHDVVMHNTGITLMQDDVFDAMPHEEICDNMTAEFSGIIANEFGGVVSGVDATLTVSGVDSDVTTNNDGMFTFGDVASCYTENLSLIKDDSHISGVTVMDLITIQRHLLTVDLLDSPYQLIAADVNASGDISIEDLVQIRRLILNLAPTFPNNKAWHFVPSSYEFEDATQPWNEDYPEGNFDYDVISQDLMENYIAIKTGDVTGDGANFNNELEDRNLDVFALGIENMTLEAGRQYQVNFNSNQFIGLEGLQMAIGFDKSLVNILGAEGGELARFNENNINIIEENEVVRLVWNGEQRLLKGDAMFSLWIEAKEKTQLNQAVNLAKAEMQAVAYDEEMEPLNLALTFQNADNFVKGFELMGNYPNPFVDATDIAFSIEDASDVNLIIQDLSGRTVLVKEFNFNEGNHIISIDNKDLPHQGVYFYTLETTFGRKTMRMMKL
jgi:hypothetical protein